MSFIEPPKENIQTVIQMLMPFTYSMEYMDSIDYDRDRAENPFMFDVSICVQLLGGILYTKNDINIQ